MSLSGFDIANVNGPGAITPALAGDFIILKSTEGLTFIDQYHDGWAAQVRAAGKLLGHYHYAHVTNDPAAEAQAFIAAAKAQPGEVLALDFEPYGQTAPDSVYPGWIVAFAGEVERLTGVKPWIYLNDDMGNRVIAQATSAQLATIRDLPLWKAAAPGLLGWSAVTCFQSSSAGADQDTFYGDAAAWHALGIPTSTTPPVTASKETDMLLLVNQTNGATVLLFSTGQVKPVLNTGDLAAFQGALKTVAVSDAQYKALAG